jgi:hypothetical protein
LLEKLIRNDGLLVVGAEYSLERVVGAEYSLESGIVTFFDGVPAEAAQFVRD